MGQCVLSPCPHFTTKNWHWHSASATLALHLPTHTSSAVTLVQATITTPFWGPPTTSASHQPRPYLQNIESWTGFSTTASQAPGLSAHLSPSVPGPQQAPVSGHLHLLLPVQGCCSRAAHLQFFSKKSFPESLILIRSSLSSPGPPQVLFYFFNAVSPLLTHMDFTCGSGMFASGYWNKHQMTGLCHSVCLAHHMGFTYIWKVNVLNETPELTIHSCPVWNNLSLSPPYTVLLLCGLGRNQVISR